MEHNLESADPLALPDADNKELTFILIRHGETEWNCANKRQGWLDSPLTPTGKKQIGNTCLSSLSILSKRSKLSKLSKQPIFCSDLGRAMSSARILGKNHRLTIIPMPLLREKRFSRPHRPLTDTLKEKSVQHKNRSILTHTDESNEQLTRRVAQSLIKIAQYPKQEAFIIVGHGEWIRSAISITTQAHDLSEIKMPNNGSVTTIKISVRVLMSFLKPLEPM